MCRIVIITESHTVAVVLDFCIMKATIRLNFIEFLKLEQL